MRGEVPHTVLPFTNALYPLNSGWLEVAPITLSLGRAFCYPFCCNYNTAGGKSVFLQFTIAWVFLQVRRNGGRKRKLHRGNLQCCRKNIPAPWGENYIEKGETLLYARKEMRRQRTVRPPKGTECVGAMFPSEDCLSIRAGLFAGKTKRPQRK